jgi:hypothetical protein
VRFYNDTVDRNYVNMFSLDLFKAIEKEMGESLDDTLRLVVILAGEKKDEEYVTKDAGSSAATGYSDKWVKQLAIKLSLSEATIAALIRVVQRLSIPFDSPNVGVRGAGLFNVDEIELTDSASKANVELLASTDALSVVSTKEIQPGDRLIARRVVLKEGAEADAKKEAAAKEKESKVDGPTCCVCGETKDRAEFSKAQMKKPVKNRKCLVCADGQKTPREREFDLEKAAETFQASEDKLAWFDLFKREVYAKVFNKGSPVVLDWTEAPNFHALFEIREALWEAFAEHPFARSLLATCMIMSANDDTDGLDLVPQYAAHICHVQQLERFFPKPWISTDYLAWLKFYKKPDLQREVVKFLNEALKRE